MKRILVTGGFGFLGSHLIERLLDDDENHVHVVDNLSTNPVPLDLLMPEIKHQDRLTYDLCSVAAFAAEERQPFNEIYHLASIVGPAGVLGHAGAIAASIIDDSLRVAGWARAMGAKLLDVSTSEVYGGGQEGLCAESMPSIVSPRASARLEYALGKLASECSLLNLHRETGLDVRIIRPFNISGPRQSGRGGFVLPRFIGQALAGRNLTVFGDGQQLRAFTHVADIVEGMIAAVERGQSGEMYNVGAPQNKCTILALAERVIDLAGSTSQIEFVDPRSIYGELFEEANDKFPDASKAERELGWTPRFDRDATIKETVDYMASLPGDVRAALSGA